LCDLCCTLFYITHVFSFCLVLLSKLSSIYFFSFIVLCSFVCVFKFFFGLFVVCKLLWQFGFFSMWWLCTTSLLAWVKGLYLFILVVHFFLCVCVCVCALVCFSITHLLVHWCVVSQCNFFFVTFLICYLICCWGVGVFELGWVKSHKWKLKGLIHISF
jgi:hypothetical protein